MAHLSVPSPVGTLSVFVDDGAVVALDWGRVEYEAGEGNDAAILQKAAEQLTAYFDGTLKSFDLPLRPEGSDHDRAVWREMTRIPYGDQITYGDIAGRIGSVARAVGGACGANPIPIIIPCHRVVGAGGRMTGFSGGEGVETKQWLLRHEGALLI
ncbi:MAG: methylated-DNA--[protein]-cysteine S-methyltransferase [Rhodospirillales bacterium]